MNLDNEKIQYGGLEGQAEFRKIMEEKKLHILQEKQSDLIDRQKHHIEEQDKCISELLKYIEEQRKEMASSHEYQQKCLVQSRLALRKSDISIIVAVLSLISSVLIALLG